MPKHKHPLARLQHLNDIFNTRRGAQSVVTSEELIERLDISLRQLRTDMEVLRSKGAPLEYVAAKRGWRYAPGAEFTLIDQMPLTSEDVLHLRVAFETLAKAGQMRDFEQLPEVFGKIHRAVRNWVSPNALQKAIYFDPLSRYEGAKHLTFFLKAIEESRRVEFQYLAFHADTPRAVLFDPWFLRHYDRRWYVGGFSHDPDEQFVRVFPLERITGEPEMVGFYHDKPQAYNAETYWRHIYGISVPKGGKIEQVILALSPLQAKYFMSSPFFEPYVVIESTEKVVVITMDLMVNVDLVQKLASYGAGVRVLKPDSLVDTMKHFFREALAKIEQRPL